MTHLKIKPALMWLAGTAAFVAAAAFAWGGAEAVANRFLPPPGTFHPDSLLASAFDRCVFYLPVVAAATFGAAAAAALRRLGRKGAGARPKRARNWRGAAAAASVLIFNAGWLVLAVGKVINQRSRFMLKMLDPPWFGAYWLVALAAAAAATAASGVVLSARPWWRSAGRAARVAGAAALVVLAAAHFGLRARRPVPRGPDVVVVVLDAWRGDAFRPDTMPYMDDFARRHALRFPRAWSCASWTIPAMGSLFTGQYPDVHGGRFGPTADTYCPSLAQRFRAAGYETAAIVGNRLLDRHNPVGDGFEDYYFWDWNPGLRALRFYETNWYGPAMRTLLHRDLTYETSLNITGALEEFLARRHRRPYFLWVHYMDPHVPYAPPPGYYDAVDEKFISSYRPRRRELAWHYRRLYEDECSYVDALLAPSLARFAAAENAVVVITGDHGEEFWEHKTFEHGKSVYDAVTRVPFILRVPGRRAEVVDTAVSHVDVAPTLLTLAGLPVPATMEGRPLFAAAGRVARRPVFIGGRFLKLRDYKPERQDAVIVWPRKLILYDARLEAPGEYYDLAADPEEKHPLAEDAAAREMREMVKRWKIEVTGRPGADAEEDATAAADLKALGYVR